MRTGSRANFPLLILAALAAGLFGACNDEKSITDAPDRQQEKLVVLATVYPLADLAREIGGEWVTVEWLAESGQPLPGRTPPEDVYGRARSADVIVSSGEDWATEGYDDPMRAGRVVRLDVLPAATSFASTRGLMWLDPAVGREAAVELYKCFALKRPRLEPYFRQRRDQFLERLDVVVKPYEGALRTQPARVALVLSSDWARLLNRYQIAEVGLREDVTTTAALTAANVRQLRDLARQYGLTEVIVSTETPPAVIDELQRRTDLTARTLERLGTSAGFGRNSYLDILKYNLDQLNQAASRGK
jgi:ABC-type Zn uptake system ZnuABC Zn-binding protein ZnuA